VSGCHRAWQSDGRPSRWLACSYRAKDAACIGSAVLARRPRSASLLSPRAAIPSRTDTAREFFASTAWFDAALKMRPNYMEAILYKSIVLRLQAQRVEQAKKLQSARR
jgi:hypothetical protein